MSKELMDEMIYDDDFPVVTLLTDDGEEIDFIEVAVVNYKNENYSILQPIELFEGMAEDEALVFKIGVAENGEDRFEMVTDDELIDLVVGAGMFNVKNHFEAFGCAGFTTSKLIDKKICNVGLADGPAGLRLQKRTAVLKDGSTKPIDAMMEFMNYFPKFVKIFMFGNPKKDKILYKYSKFSNDVIPSTSLPFIILIEYGK